MFGYPNEHLKYEQYITETRAAEHMSGECALAVFVQQQHTLAESMHGRIDTMWRYVPGAIKNRTEWNRRMAAVSEQERELCNLVPVPAEVSREVRRMRHECTTVPRRERDYPAWARHRLENDIKGQMKELLNEMGDYVCDDEEYIPRRYADTDFHRHVLVRTLRQVHKVYDFAMTYGEDMEPHHTYITVRELLLVLDVLPHLQLPTDDVRMRKLGKMCERIVCMTHALYTCSTDFVQLDNFMNRAIYIESELFGVTDPGW